MRHGKIIACLGVKPEELEKVSNLLNELLMGEFYCFKALSHKSWTIYGPRYSILQPLLCLQARECMVICDEIAEKVREHGCFVTPFREFEQKGLPFKDLEDLPQAKGFDFKHVPKEDHIIEAVCTMHELLSQKFHLAARMAKKEYKCWSTADFLLEKERCHERMAHKMRAHLDREGAEFLSLTRCIQERSESGEKYGLSEKYGMEREKGVQGQQGAREMQRGQQVPVK
jgi:DNA-binding ferritin-like protein